MVHAIERYDHADGFCVILYSKTVKEYILDRSSPEDDELDELEIELYMIHLNVPDID
jgi:hypothetical protein